MENSRKTTKILLSIILFIQSVRFCGPISNNLIYPNHNEESNKTHEPLPDIYSFDIDTTNNKIYWIYRGKGQIWRSDLNNSKSEIILLCDSGADNIRIDNLHKKIYWLSENNLNRANLDGTSTETTSSDLPGYVLEFELEPETGNIYWLDWTTNTIFRTSFYFKNRKNISTSLLENVHPKNLRLDRTNKRIYWSTSESLSSDSIRFTIKSKTFDGLNENIFYTKKYSEFSSGIIKFEINPVQNYLYLGDIDESVEARQLLILLNVSKFNKSGMQSWGNNNLISFPLPNLPDLSHCISIRADLKNNKIYGTDYNGIEFKVLNINELGPSKEMIQKSVEEYYKKKSVKGK